ncbi:MAG: hypothetical protein LBL78_04025 [Prevotellaceae bacterium]|jgi:hypothetical protein|nr:hypothetical protein [Prevotellaceae bacterium]
MKLTQASFSLLETTIRKVIGLFALAGDGECGPSVVTDIHLQANPNSGELLLFNDDEEELGTAIVDEWTACNVENFYKEAERILTTLLGRLKEQGAFDKPTTLMKPYSFVLVDDDKETLAELLLVDDDTLLVNESLLKGLDEDLDTFLKDLLEQPL